MKPARSTDLRSVHWVKDEPPKPSKEERRFQRDLAMAKRMDAGQRFMPRIDWNLVAAFIFVGGSVLVIVGGFLLSALNSPDWIALSAIGWLGPLLIGISVAQLTPDAALTKDEG